MDIVIGKGNLGKDLEKALIASGQEVTVVSLSDGFDYRTFQWYGHPPRCIWVAAGIGSIKECEANPTKALETHAIMPLELYKRFPETFFVFFSTDYCATEAGMWPTFRSFYEITKHALERGFDAMNYANHNVLGTHGCVVRVGSLYGRHFPDKCLPYKLLSSVIEKGYASCVTNKITPTPTDWLAETLVKNFHRLPEEGFHNVAPQGNVSVIDFAKTFIDEDLIKETPITDQRRPYESKLVCKFERIPTWLELWTARKDDWV